MTWTALRLAPPTPGSAATANANVRLIAVDPWSHGKKIDLHGQNTYLSFPNAIQAVVEEIGQGAQAAIGLAVTAASLTDLAGNLNGLGNAFALPNLQRLARRATELAQLEISKWNLVPYGHAEKSTNMSSLPTVKSLRRADLLKAAKDNAAAFSSSGLTGKLGALQSEKTAHDTAVDNAQGQASAGLTGSPPGCWRFYAEGDIASALLQGHPGHEFNLTSIMLFMGSIADLALLKQVLREPLS
jgi:hypothetical protein